MLTAIVNEMRNSSGPVTLRYISRKLSLDESAVEGMIETLIHKGIVRDHARYLQELQTCGDVSFCNGCSQKNCPVSGNMPRTFSLVTIKKINH
ncbi:MAG: FeoC-like transcriptional regulator [Anaerolineae bacterium]|nr:FeoC-like transcriptional regulator [Anaerolineae bacterium]